MTVKRGNNEQLGMRSEGRSAANGANNRPEALKPAGELIEVPKTAYKVNASPPHSGANKASVGGKTLTRSVC
jgi:hypothetical protein